ncbi:hypothetical protein H2248_001806 [Termitomyces sp. 'cryptogamus']|nr:hypothetical protein H2248_001806 [Termitomyces sp. 'cryptogamus']
MLHTRCGVFLQSHVEGKSPVLSAPEPVDQPRWSHLHYLRHSVGMLLVVVECARPREGREASAEPSVDWNARDSSRKGKLLPQQKGPEWRIVKSEDTTYMF